jgi:hypothetical protein
MGLLNELINELEQVKSKVRPMLDRIEELKSQIVAELGVQTVVTAPATEVFPPVQTEKSARKPRSGTPLRVVVQNILAKNPEGLELKNIVAEVHDMIQRGEYSSHAKNLTAVVYQAVNSLREEKLVHQNKESKRYTTTVAA